VVLKPGYSLSDESVRKLFENRLARYKHPRRVVFVDRLPRNATGKVQKAELRQLVDAKLDGAQPL
jgi:acyl-coenzyme A synthetase/AMP-(fatty) acid ligase